MRLDPIEAIREVGRAEAGIHRVLPSCGAACPALHEGRGWMFNPTIDRRQLHGCHLGWGFEVKKFAPVLVLLVLVGGCLKVLGVGESDDERRERRLSEQFDRDAERGQRAAAREAVVETEGDGAAQNACRRFRSVADDAAAGVITDRQLVERLQDVWDSAKYTAVDEVRAGVQTLLANAIDGEDTYGASRDLGAACDSIGQ